MVGHEKPEVTDVGCIFGEDDVAGELARREPEGKVGRLAELELSVDSGGEGASLGRALLSQSPISDSAPKPGTPGKIVWGRGLAGSKVSVGRRDGTRPSKRCPSSGPSSRAAISRNLV